MTILKIKKRTNPYLQIDKTPIEDENLSWRARGMLAYLIGRPPNWEVSVNQLTKASDSDGRRAVQSTLKELEDGNYLIRYPYHNPETGLMDGWKSIVFETPTDCKNWKAYNLETGREGEEGTGREKESFVTNPPVSKSPSPPSPNNSPTDTFCACRELARRSSRPSENSTQINIEVQTRKNLITSPLTPLQNENLEEKRKEEEENLNSRPNASNTKISDEPIDHEDYWKKEDFSSSPTPLNPCRTNTSVNQKNVTLTSLANKSCLEGENKEGDVVLRQTSVQRTTKTYDSALGIKPPEEQKNLQARFNSWIPDGVWKVNGKLDPNFVDWLALDWVKSYGGDIHKKRADVLRYFKKDPANIAISWTQYEAETRHRYENAAVRMHNGMAIAPDEQQQLISRSRAFCEKMSDEINPVAEKIISVSYLGQLEGETDKKVDTYQIEGQPVNSSNNEGVRSSNNLFFQAEVQSSAEEINLVDSSQSLERSEQVVSSTPPKDIPRDEKGSAENPEAYRIWQPERLEGERVNPAQIREKLAFLSQRLAMAKPVKERKPPQDEIEKLNEWLTEPLLRKTAMARVMKSDDLTVEFDSEGVPIRVIKIRGEENE